jgi:hypothetical protein
VSPELLTQLMGRMQAHAQAGTLTVTGGSCTAYTAHHFIPSLAVICESIRLQSDISWFQAWRRAMALTHRRGGLAALPPV